MELGMISPKLRPGSLSHNYKHNKWMLINNEILSVEKRAKQISFKMYRSEKPKYLIYRFNHLTPLYFLILALRYFVVVVVASFKH